MTPLVISGVVDNGVKVCAPLVRNDICRGSQARGYLHDRFFEVSDENVERVDGTGGDGTGGDGTGGGHLQRVIWKRVIYVFGDIYIIHNASSRTHRRDVVGNQIHSNFGRVLFSIN